VGLLDELFEDKLLESQIESFELIPASGGKFEVTVNGDLVFSKAPVPGRDASFIFLAAFAAVRNSAYSCFSPLFRPFRPIFRITP
jgi:hypothetical protein